VGEGLDPVAMCLLLTYPFLILGDHTPCHYCNSLKFGRLEMTHPSLMCLSPMFDTNNIFATGYMLASWICFFFIPGATESLIVIQLDNGLCSA
jgi:hypothetical protein